MKKINIEALESLNDSFFFEDDVRDVVVKEIKKNTKTTECSKASSTKCFIEGDIETEIGTFHYDVEMECTHEEETIYNHPYDNDYLDVLITYEGQEVEGYNEIGFHELQDL